MNTYKSGDVVVYGAEGVCIITGITEKKFDNEIISSDFIFLSDYVFSSPSLAASVVMGRSANGRTEWKTIDNRSIKDIEEG